VVATSGNLSEEPLCTDNEDARQRLGTIADLFLVHDRPIARPVDDSVLRRAAAGPVLLRRARGFAPAPFQLPEDAAATEPLLCVGGHLKSTIAMTTETSLVLSPHIGDLSNPVSMEAFRRTVAAAGLFSTPDALPRVVCDAHPDYASTRFGPESGRWPVVTVQHHLAHILACLLEHGGGPETVLGVAWTARATVPTERSGAGSLSWSTGWPRQRGGWPTCCRFDFPVERPAVARATAERASGFCTACWPATPRVLEPLARSLGFRDREAAVCSHCWKRGVQASGDNERRPAF